MKRYCVILHIPKHQPPSIILLQVDKEADQQSKLIFELFGNVSLIAEHCLNNAEEVADESAVVTEYLVVIEHEPVECKVAQPNDIVLANDQPEQGAQ